jgi:hypothetical protein
MNTVRPVPEKFLVAFSFAGEQRDLVRRIAEAVEQRLGRGTVFFDEWYEHYLAGAASDVIESGFEDFKPSNLPEFIAEVRKVAR